MFDATKLDGKWLSAEDKHLYKLQLESGRQVGYSTGKCADIQTIHPSKRMKASTSASTSAPSYVAPQGTDTESEPEDSRDESYQPEDAHFSLRQHHRTAIATNLVTGTNVSTSKAAKICRKLSEEGVEIPTPSQPGVYKALFRKATQVRPKIRYPLFFHTHSSTKHYTQVFGSPLIHYL